MDVIFAEIIQDEEGRTITKKDLIYDGFDCEIFVNKIRFSNNLTLKKGNNNIIYIFKNKYKNLNLMFYGCSLLTTVDLSNFNSQVTTMTNIFRDCSNLSSINFSNFDTNNVTNWIVCSLIVLN